MTVTFFGHRNPPKQIHLLLEEILIDLIQNHNADIFYVGNHGGFDYMVKETLKNLKLIYTHITYAVVLAYLPSERDEFDVTDYSDTIYPVGLEKTPPRYAIIKRNRWMLDKADTVVTYVTHSVSGVAQFKELAEKKGKRVINITDIE